MDNEIKLVMEFNFHYKNVVSWRRETEIDDIFVYALVFRNEIQYLYVSILLKLSGILY